MKIKMPQFRLEKKILASRVGKHFVSFGLENMPETWGRKISLQTLGREKCWIGTKCPQIQAKKKKFRQVRPKKKKIAGVLGGEKIAGELAGLL